MAISRLSIAKFFELAVAAVCVFLHYKTISAESEPHTKLLIAGTFVGYTIILIALLAGHLLQTPVNKRLDIFFSLIGCTLFVSSGALIIQNYNESGYNDNNIIANIFRDEEQKKMILSKGSLAIINGALFLIDVFFTIKD